jgi:hypothetical protein
MVTLSGRIMGNKTERGGRKRGKAHNYEHYSVKLCLQLGKSSIEMLRMLKTLFDDDVFS